MIANSESQQEQELTFYPIWLRFTVNMWTILEFSQQTTQFADKFDEKELRNRAKELAGILGDDYEVIEQELQEYFDNLPNAEYELDLLNDTESKEILNQFNKRIDRLRTEHYSRYQTFKKWWRLFLEKPPVNGPISRRGSLMILVGYFELLIDDLVKYYNDHIADSASHIKQLGTDGRLKRLLTILDKLAFKQNLSEVIAKYTEIDARRNIFTHNDGIIDDTYLEDITELAINKPGKGKQFTITPKYLNQAIETVFIYGAIMALCCWQEWHPDQQYQADIKFNEFLYSALLHKKYEMIIRLVDARKMFGELSDIPKIIFVNQAVAYRELGNKNKVTTIIEELEQGKPDRLIMLAIAVLKENKTEIQKILTEFNRQNYGKLFEIDWPLFNPIRRYDWFIKIIRARGSLPK